MNYKQQEKAFTAAFKTMDKQWNTIVASNIATFDKSDIYGELIDLVTKNFVHTIQNIFPTSTTVQINYIINNYFNHILELNFNEFYNFLNNVEIINQVR